jgi:hypothetical protein
MIISTTASRRQPFFAARTLTGRTVFGGDGILPDKSVVTPNYAAGQAALSDPLFFFVRSLVNGRVPISAYRPASFSTGAREPEDLASAAFAAFVRADNSWAAAARSLRGEGEYIRLRLRYNLALATEGMSAAERLDIQSDLQAAKAIESLPEASELALRALRSRNSRH